MAGAMVAYITAAAAGAKDHTLADYLPRWKPDEPMETDEMLAALQRLAAKQKG